MKRLLYNIGYFIREAKILFKSNMLSNVFSLMSIGFVFSILVLVLIAGFFSETLVENLGSEAEISVYFDENISNESIASNAELINKIEGVENVQIVTSEDAYKQMEDVLGEEAKVLSYFEGNPFSPFVEVGIHIDQLDSVLKQIEDVKGVNYIRDNKEILLRLEELTKVIKLFVYILLVISSVSTLVIISHIIRQGIYQNREQLNTLTLLGAPTVFKSIPFVLVGLFMTTFGGVMATGVVLLFSHSIYRKISESIPFIPLPEQGMVIKNIIMIMLFTSIILGGVGSLFGLATANDKR